jgi:putative phosphoesterase
MKIVIISDVHANYEALCTLPEIGDELWVLGDLVNYGPQPAEVIEFLQARASVIVRGNHDHSVATGEDPQCSLRFRKMADATRRFTESVLSEEQKAFLGNLPLTAEVQRGKTRFFLCHAVPSEPLFEYCPADSERWVSECARTGAEILLVGHTHLPFIRRIGEQVVANPGSLGQPKTGRAEACYAAWEDGSLRLCSFPYPLEKTVARIRELPLSEDVQADLTEVLRTGSVPEGG